MSAFFPSPLLAEGEPGFRAAQSRVRLSEPIKSTASPLLVGCGSKPRGMS
jgi:hypothetical protein